MRSAFAWTNILALWACLAASAVRPLSAVAPLQTLAAQPYGLRLAIGSSPGGLQLTWSTDAAMSGQPCVQLQPRVDALAAKALPGGMDLLQAVALRAGRPAGVWQACGTTRPFTEPSTTAVSQYIHTASLGGLLPGDVPLSLWFQRRRLVPLAPRHRPALSTPPTLDRCTRPPRRPPPGFLPRCSRC